MATARQNVLDFNDIETSLSKGMIEMLKNLYAYYHWKHYGYEKLYRGFQRKKSALQYCCRQSYHNFRGCRGHYFKPVVFASLTGFGLVVKAVRASKNTTKGLSTKNP